MVSVLLLLPLGFMLVGLAHGSSNGMYAQHVCHVVGDSSCCLLETLKLAEPLPPAYELLPRDSTHPESILPSTLEKPPRLLA